VGPLHNLTSALVVLDTERYVFNSATEAIKFTFILFFALNAKYPETSRMVWQLLQIAVFGIKTKADIRNIELGILISRLLPTNTDI